MQTPPSLLPHDFCSPGRKRKNPTHYRPTGRLSLSHSLSFAKKVDVKEAAARVGGRAPRPRSSAPCSTRVHDAFYMTFIYSCGYLLQYVSNQADTVRLCIRRGRRLLPSTFLLKHYTLTQKRSWRFKTKKEILRIYVTKLTFVYLSFHSCRTHRHSSCLVVALLSVWM